MIVLLDKGLADGSLSRNTRKLAEKALKKSHATYAEAQLSHILGSQDEPIPTLRKIRMGFQQRYARQIHRTQRDNLRSNRRERRRRPGYTTRLQKENRNLMEKVERLEQEYNKLRKASEFIMSIID